MISEHFFESGSFYAVQSTKEMQLLADLISIMILYVVLINQIVFLFIQSDLKASNGKY